MGAPGSVILAQVRRYLSTSGTTWVPLNCTESAISGVFNPSLCLGAHVCGQISLYHGRVTNPQIRKYGVWIRQAGSSRTDRATPASLIFLRETRVGKRRRCRPRGVRASGENGALPGDPEGGAEPKSEEGGPGPL